MEVPDETILKIKDATIKIVQKFVFPEFSELKTLRKKLKITQVQLSQMTGIPQSSISRWELGTTDIPYSKAKKLFQTLKNLERND